MMDWLGPIVSFPSFGPVSGLRIDKMQSWLTKKAVTFVTLLLMYVSYCYYSLLSAKIGNKKGNRNLGLLPLSH